MPENEIGKIKHYYKNISVGVIVLTGTLKVGNKIRIQGAMTDFVQDVDSIQIEKKDVESAEAGQQIGIRILEPVKENDKVYLVEDES